MATSMHDGGDVQGVESKSCCEENCCCDEANLLLGMVSDTPSWTLSGSHPLYNVSWLAPATVVPELSTPPPRINPGI
ncbi:MAG: hypothetical protein ACE5FQ_11385 [Thiogranum sp.]